METLTCHILHVYSISESYFFFISHEDFNCSSVNGHCALVEHYSTQNNNHSWLNRNHIKHILNCHRVLLFAKHCFCEAVIERRKNEIKWQWKKKFLSCSISIIAECLNFNEIICVFNSRYYSKWDNYCHHILVEFFSLEVAVESFPRRIIWNLIILWMKWSLFLQTTPPPVPFWSFHFQL